MEQNDATEPLIERLYVFTYDVIQGSVGLSAQNELVDSAISFLEDIALFLYIVIIKCNFSKLYCETELNIAYNL